VQVSTSLLKHRCNLTRTDNLSETRKAPQNDQWIRVGRCLRCDNRTDKGAEWGQIETRDDSVDVDQPCGTAVAGGADGLCHALAVQLGSMDFDFGNIPSISTLVNCC